MYPEDSANDGNSDFLFHFLSLSRKVFPDQYPQILMLTAQLTATKNFNLPTFLGFTCHPAI